MTAKTPEGARSIAQTAKTDTSTPQRPRVVIVGGGFGGLAASKALANSSLAVTLVDQHNYHLFQPLLYQVATRLSRLAAVVQRPHLFPDWLQEPAVRRLELGMGLPTRHTVDHRVSSPRMEDVPRPRQLGSAARPTRKTGATVAR